LNLSSMTPCFSLTTKQFQSALSAAETINWIRILFRGWWNTYLFIDKLGFEARHLLPLQRRRSTRAVDVRKENGAKKSHLIAGREISALIN
jgi:hypothetical protein